MVIGHGFRGLDAVRILSVGPCILGGRSVGSGTGDVGTPHLVASAGMARGGRAATSRYLIAGQVASRTLGWGGIYENKVTITGRICLLGREPPPFPVVRTPTPRPRCVCPPASPRLRASNFLLVIIGSRVAGGRRYLHHPSASAHLLFRLRRPSSASYHPHPRFFFIISPFRPRHCAHSYYHHHDGRDVPGSKTRKALGEGWVAWGGRGRAGATHQAGILHGGPCQARTDGHLRQVRTLLMYSA